MSFSISKVLDGVFDDDLGWRPASGAIKPVHVANGLVRAVQDRYYDLELLNAFAVPWKKKGQSMDEARAFDVLAPQHADRFGYLARNREGFEKARKYVRGLVTADKAVFPSAEHSSFTLTGGLLASRDHNDRGLGEFAAFILGDGAGSLREAVTKAAQVAQADDPISALIWPLLADRAGTEPKKGDDSRANSFQHAAKQKHNKAIFLALRDASDSLATHERGHGNRLKTLQRSVHFACIATFAHAQAAAANGVLDARVPGLIAVAGDRRSDVALASERSVENIFVAFERWLADRLGERIGAGRALASGGGGRSKSAEPTIDPTNLDGRSVKAMLREFGVAQTLHDEPKPELVDHRYRSFVAARKELGDDDAARVLGHTLARCYFDEADSGKPRTFLQGLACRVGLLYPHFQGRARAKRLRPNPPVLDVLVRSCVPAGEAVDLDTFLARLWMRFGLIVGGRRSTEWDDVAFLEALGIPINIDQLAANTEAFVDEIEVMGLARRYPDGVTFVGEHDA
jgi:hypothetical protein